MRKFLTFLFSFFSIISNTAALPFYISHVEAPDFVEFRVGGLTLENHFDQNIHYLFIPQTLIFPFRLEVVGPLGEKIFYEIKSPAELKPLKVAYGIVTSKEANPKTLNTLPALCPRVRVLKNEFFKNHLIFDASQDRLNHVPIMQLLDPDATKGKQYKSYSEMDGKNALLVRHVKITYDYEDTKIIDYIGSHPLTGKEHIVPEGEGGFYANLHYAVIPYMKELPDMEPQLLLHMAQGKLAEIEEEEHRPALRTHSFLPGPYLSRAGTLYDLCEWGDTSHQVPKQEMDYEAMAIWDWDYSVKNSDHVWLIVWEGDEEDWMIKKQLIHPFYLTDDLIGLFEIKRKNTVKPLTLKNTTGDFEITVQTGDLVP